MEAQHVNAEYIIQRITPSYSEARYQHQDNNAL